MPGVAHVVPCGIAHTTLWHLPQGNQLIYLRVFSLSDVLLCIMYRDGVDVPFFAVFPELQRLDIESPGQMEYY